MASIETVIALALAVSALAYLVYVNRATQAYGGRFRVDAPVETVWDIIRVPEDGPVSFGDLPGASKRTDPATRESIMEVAGGFLIRTRVLLEDAPTRLETIYEFDPAGRRAHPDQVRSAVRLEPVAGGTEVTVEYVVERRGLLAGLFQRTTHPFKVRSIAHVVRLEIAKRRAAAGPAPQRAPWWARVAPSPLQAVLGLVALAWLTLTLGWLTGAAFWATILVHEWGHVLAMRRLGQGTARFYFLPLFGGVAVGARFGRDAETLVVMLAGPLAGLAPGLALALAAVGAREGWLPLAPENAGVLTMMATLSLLLNLFNLLPVVPLDGGHAVHILLRPFAGRAWIVISGLALLAALAASAASLTAGVIVAAVVLGLLWLNALRDTADAVPLPVPGILAGLSAYLALAAAHVAAMGLMYVTPGGPIGPIEFVRTFLWAVKFAVTGP